METGPYLGYARRRKFSRYMWEPAIPQTFLCSTDIRAINAVDFKRRRTNNAPSDKGPFKNRTEVL